MGGPNDALGWLFFASFLGAPLLILWTWSSGVALYVQYFVFAIVFVLVVYYAVVAFSLD